MMPLTTVKTIEAVAIRNDGPNSNFYHDKRIYIRGGATYGATLLNFALPAPRKAVYKSAKLRLYCQAPYPGTYSLFAKRILNPWDPTTVTINTSPGSSVSQQVGLTVTNPLPGTMTEFDITPILNSASNGEYPWYGLSLETATDTGSNWIYYFHPQGPNLSLVPLLEVEWYDKPNTPSQLNPANNQVVSKSNFTFQCDFVDVVGATSMSAIQVQISTSSSFTSPLWDSGTVLTPFPELPLSNATLVPSPPSFSNGTNYRWRVRVRDSANLWSDWSLDQGFSIIPKTAITVSSPAASPNNVVVDPTPTIIWNPGAGVTQTGYQVLVYDMAKTVLLHDSGLRTGPNTSYTINNWNTTNNKEMVVSPLKEGTTFTLVVRVWDNVNRAITPGDSAFSSLQRSFTFSGNPALAKPSAISVTNKPNTPWTQIDVAMASAPDYFSLWRDGSLIAHNLIPSDYMVSPGNYRFFDTTVTPREIHTWEVRSIINGVSSQDNPIATGQNKPITAYLSDIPGTWAIPFFNYSVELDGDDGSSTISVLNSNEVLTIYGNGGGGREGTMSGLISKTGSVRVAKESLSLLLLMKTPTFKGYPLVLTYADQKMICTISKINYMPVVYSEEICYSVSFHVAERLS